MPDLYTAILLEIVIVLLVGFIPIPRWWPDNLFFSAEIITSVVAFAWLGLLAWALYAAVFYFVPLDGPKTGFFETSVETVITFVKHHPLLALCVGPAISIYMRISLSLRPD